MGEHNTAFKQRWKSGVELRLENVLVGTVAVQHARCGPVQRDVVASPKGHGDPDAVACRDPDPRGGVALRFQAGGGRGVDLHPVTGLEVDVPPGRGHRAALGADRDRTGVELVHPRQTDRGRLVRGWDVVGGRPVPPDHSQQRQAVPAQGQDDVPGECVGRHHPHVRLVGDDLPPGSERVGRTGQDPELRRLVVGDHQQFVAAIPRSVVDGVLRAPAAPGDRTRRGRGVAGRQQPALAGVPAAGLDEDPLPRTRTAHCHLEGLVVLLQNQPVGVRRGPKDVFAHLPGPHGMVRHDVEESGARRVPRTRVIGVGHLVRQILSGRQVTETQRVLLGAGQVDRPRQDAVSGSGLDQAELGIGRSLLPRNSIEVDQRLDRPVSAPRPAGKTGQIRSGPKVGQVCVVSPDETDRHVSVGQKPAHVGSKFIP